MTPIPDITGVVCGVKFKDRGDGHIMLQLMIEDDEFWHPKNFEVSSYFIDDLIEVATATKIALQNRAQPDGSWGYKFK